MLKFLEIQYWYENCCLKLCWTAPNTSINAVRLNQNGNINGIRAAIIPIVNLSDQTIATGFLFSKVNMIITANHVFNGENELRCKIEINGREELKPKIIKICEKSEYDVAIAEIELGEEINENHALIKGVFSFSKKIPKIGDSIILLSQSRADKDLVTLLKANVIENNTRSMASEKAIWIEAENKGGDSGAPILDKNGNIIGFLSTGFNDGIASFVHYSFFRKENILDFNCDFFNGKSKNNCSFQDLEDNGAIMVN